MLLDHWVLLTSVLSANINENAEKAAVTIKGIKVSTNHFPCAPSYLKEVIILEKFNKALMYTHFTLADRISRERIDECWERQRESKNIKISGARGRK